MPWDGFIRGAAVGASVVMIAFLAISGIVYFTTDYDFATVVAPGESPVSPPPASPPPASPPPSPTEPPSDLDGQAITQRTGCTACHSTDGSVLVGPSWQGLIGSERTFEDGSSLVADAAYVRESIVDPPARVVADFPPIMPQVYEDQLSDAEIAAIVAYIGTL